MVIIGKASWPTESTAEMGRRFMLLSHLPESIVGRDYIKSIESLGVKVISIYHCDQSNLTEAIEVCQRRYTSFFGVPGFTFTVDLWFEAPEALDLIGVGGE